MESSSHSGYARHSSGRSTPGSSSSNSRAHIRRAMDELEGQTCLTPKAARRMSQQQPHASPSSLIVLPPPNSSASPLVMKKHRWRNYGQWAPPPSPPSSTSKSDCVGKCVLCLLINAIFVFGIFVAFIIGHWASKGRLPWVGTPPSSRGKGSGDDQFHRLPTLHQIYPPMESYYLAEKGQEEVDITSGLPVHLGTVRSEHGERRDDAGGQEGHLVPLPKNVWPTHYELHLDFTELHDQHHIRGNASIALESFGNSTDDELIFHAAANIFIHRIRLKRKEKTVSVKSVKRHFERDLVRVVLNERLERASYHLGIEFRTKVCQNRLEATHCIPGRRVVVGAADRIEGFTTKFEPYFARTFIPCWDEPRLRTTFNLSVRHLPLIDVGSDERIPLIVLANGEVVSRTILTTATGVTTTLTEYGLTPSMPIHQLAFAVGPFTALELGRAGSSRLGPFTLWIPYDQEVPGVQFAANFSSLALDRVEKDLGVRYPLAKLDFVLTRSFPVGGMESWGLVIFHLASVLLPPGEATLFTVGRRGGRAAKREVDRLWAVYKVERLVTHELVHQWFGNLVSMAQWEEAWLSEGFATYFTYDLLNEQHPHLTEHEYYLNLIELFRRQSSTARDPLVRRIDTMDDLNRLLGSDSLYSKGAMVVKMLKDLIGTFDFRAGVTRYLNQFAMKSVGAKELWSCLPTYVMDHGADQVKIANVMETWLRNRGIPEVTVSRNYDDHSIEITQREADQNRHVVYLAEGDSTLSNSRHSRGSSVSKMRSHQRKTGDEAAMTTWEWSRSGWEEEEEQESLRSLDAGGELNITFDLSPPIRRNTTVELQTRERENYHHRHRRPLYHKGLLPLNRHHKHGKRRKHGDSSAGARNVFNQQSASSSERQREVAVFSDPATLYRIRGEANFGPKARRSHERPGLAREEEKPRWWSIPFSYAFGSVKSKGGQTSRQFWLLNETLRLVDVGLNSSVPLLANPHWIYPYRVNYDESNWRLLVDKLHSNPNEVPQMSRMQLLVDGETYLKQSATPELYVRLLAYLATERDLGVLLVGLEQIHSLIDLFSGSPVSNTIMAHLVPVVEQVDKMLVSTGREPELAAIWLLSPQRLVKLYQLRCFANVASCQHNQQLSRWLTHPTSIDASNHQQIIAVCHSLYTQAGQSEIALLRGLLQQVNSTQPQWSVLVRMSSCVQDEALIGAAVGEVVRTRNANIYLSVLNPGYSLQHHKKFREAFWRAISKLPPNERQLLFSVGTGEPSERIAHSLLHSIRTTQELDQVEGLLKQWPERLRVHFDYLRRKLRWVQGLASERIQKYLISLASSPTT